MNNFNAMLKGAYEGHYAIGSFNFYNYDCLRGILNAGKKADKPIIVAFGKKYLSNMSLEEVSALVRASAKENTAGVCLHLDHCSDMAIIEKAIDCGFDSVMYDGSALPFEENLANTKKVCELAHEKGVSVEAELGSLAAGIQSHEGNADDREVYTDPKTAARFVKETGVDALAVSIGTVHGLYKGIPNIRVDILKEIDALTRIPLVLHGGSGNPEEKILECISNGIAKINVNTEISENVVNKTRDYLQSEKPHWSVLVKKQQEWAEETVLHYIDLFQKGF